MWKMSNLRLKERCMLAIRYTEEFNKRLDLGRARTLSFRLHIYKSEIDTELFFKLCTNLYKYILSIP